MITSESESFSDLKHRFGDKSPPSSLKRKVIFSNVSDLHLQDEEKRDDLEFVLEAVKADWRSLKFASKRLRDTKVVVLAAVSIDGRALEYASESLKCDQELVFTSAMNSKSALKFVSQELKSSEKFIFALLSRMETFDFPFSYISQMNPMLMDDKDSVLNIVSIIEEKGYEMDDRLFVSERLKDDEDVVSSIMKLNPKCFRDVSKRLQNDESIANLMINESFTFDFLKWSGENIKNHKGIVMKAFKKGITSVVNIGETLRDDEEIILVAIEQSSRREEILKFVSTRLRSDPDIVFSSTIKNPDNFRYASDTLLKNRDFVISVVKNEPLSLKFCPEEIKNDPEISQFFLDGLECGDLTSEHLSLLGSAVLSDRSFALKLLENVDYEACVSIVDDSLLSCFTEIVRDDKNAVLAAVTCRGMDVQFASSRLKNDRDVALASLENATQCTRNSDAGSVFEQLSEALRDDKEIFQMALDSVLPYPWGKSNVLQFAGDTIRRDRKLVMSAIEKNPMCFNYGSHELRNDKEMVDHYIINCERVKSELFYGPSQFSGHDKIDFGEDVMNDKSIVLKLVQLDGKILKRVSLKLRQDLDVALLSLRNGGSVKDIGEDVGENELKSIYLEVVRRGYQTKEVMEHLNMKFNNKSLHIPSFLDLYGEVLEKEVEMAEFIDDEVMTNLKLHNSVLECLERGYAKEIRTLIDDRKIHHGAKTGRLTWTLKERSMERMKRTKLVNVRRFVRLENPANLI